MVAPDRTTIYEAWHSTLVPFLLPACVLSAWPVFMIIGASNRTPLKLLCILALASLADGFLGSSAFPLFHQYAFTPAQNNGLFYAGTLSYWLSGLLLGPVLEVWGTRKSCLVLGTAGVLGAVGCAQSAFVAALIGRCLSAATTTGLTTLVEYVLYDEAHLRRATSVASGRGGREENVLEKEHELQDGLGGGMLTVLHQLRPLTLWGAMLLGQHVLVLTPEVSTAPCWAAALCYVMVLLIAWLLLPLWTTGEALRLSARLRGLSTRATSGVMERILPSVVFCKGTSSANPICDTTTVQRWMRYVAGSYIISMETLLQPGLLARHLVDILFGGLFFALSLLWVPILEMYDDSVPFGFIFQLFMIARFLGATFSLPVWAVGWAEAALVALLSATARVLNTSRDYAIPVTVMLAGVATHVVAGVTKTTGSLWRAEYPSAEAPLTFLFVVKALTGVCGWMFLDVVDGKDMESVFVFKARWFYALMWIEAVALAQYIAKRTSQHRDHVSRKGARMVLVASKEENAREAGDSSPNDVSASLRA